MITGLTFFAETPRLTGYQYQNSSKNLVNIENPVNPVNPVKEFPVRANGYVSKSKRT